jgi:hypothetical protein
MGGSKMSCCSNIVTIGPGSIPIGISQKSNGYSGNGNGAVVVHAVAPVLSASEELMPLRRRIRSYRREGDPRPVTLPKGIDSQWRHSGNAGHRWRGTGRRSQARWFGAPMVALNQPPGVATMNGSSVNGNSNAIVSGGSQMVSLHC